MMTKLARLVPVSPFACAILIALSGGCVGKVGDPGSQGTGSGGSTGVSSGGAGGGSGGSGPGPTTGSGGAGSGTGGAPGGPDLCAARGALLNDIQFADTCEDGQSTRQVILLCCQAQPANDVKCQPTVDAAGRKCTVCVDAAGVVIKTDCPR